MLSLLPSLRSPTLTFYAELGFCFFSTKQCIENKVRGKKLKNKLPSEERYSDSKTLPSFWKRLNETEKMEVAISMPGDDTIEHPEFLYWRGKAYMFFDPKIAQSLFLKALEIKPNHTKSKKELKKLLNYT